MRIKALGNTVLIKPDNIEEEEITQSGIILKKNEQTRKATETGVVVDVGPLCWKDFPDPTPWAYIGDKVMFRRYAGMWVKDTDGTVYLVMNDNELLIRYLGEDE